MVVFLVVFVIAGLIATQTMEVTETLPILYLLKWCLGPVSYTHLDVYKRQLMSSNKKEMKSRKQANAKGKGKRAVRRKGR